MSYWFNTATGQVETDDTRGQAQDVLGPYETEADARGALDSAHARTEKWDAEDRAWNSGPASRRPPTRTTDGRGPAQTGPSESVVGGSLASVGSAGSVGSG